MQEILKGSESESAMDKEKAIKILRNKIECLSHSKCSDCPLDKVCDQLRTPSDSEYIAAYGMAIEALSAEPCDDCISRQAVLDLIYNSWKHNGVGENYGELSIDALKALPPVTPKQKMGRWLAVEDEDMNTVGYFCSECDLPLETEERTPFCPYCGAKMEESEDTE